MILCILQARMSSSRFPGKVLKPLLGEPMLLRQIERVKLSTLIDQLLVATSTTANDDLLVQVCQDQDIDVFRGALEDVLDRFYQAALIYKPRQVVRLTGDCPLMDPVLIDNLISYHLENCFDYSSNTIEPTFPDGLDVEIFSFESLCQAWEEAELPSEREHVTQFMINRPKRFKLGNYKNDTDLSHLRWTVDEELDYELVKIIFENLYPLNPHFSAEEVLAFLKTKPELNNINSCYIRNEGLLKSLKADQEYQKGK